MQIMFVLTFEINKMRIIYRTQYRADNRENSSHMLFLTIVILLKLTPLLPQELKKRKVLQQHPVELDKREGSSKPNNMKNE